MDHFNTYFKNSKEKIFLLCRDRNFRKREFSELRDYILSLGIKKAVIDRKTPFTDIIRELGIEISIQDVWDIWSTRKEDKRTINLISLLWTGFVVKADTAGEAEEKFKDWMYGAKYEGPILEESKLVSEASDEYDRMFRGRSMVWEFANEVPIIVDRLPSPKDLKMSFCFIEPGQIAKNEVIYTTGKPWVSEEKDIYLFSGYYIDQRAVVESANTYATKIDYFEDLAKEVKRIKRGIPNPGIIGKAQKNYYQNKVMSKLKNYRRR